MHKSFTGDARRPRNVNLSGRNKNPWANLPSNSSTVNTHSNTLLSAQAERERRQKERERLAAARTIQRVARGWAVRKHIRAEWRTQWDSREDVFTSTLDKTVSDGTLTSVDDRRKNQKLYVKEIPMRPPYHNKEELISQLQLLVSFAHAKYPTDRARIAFLAKSLQTTGQLYSTAVTSGDTGLLRRLSVLSMQAIQNAGSWVQEGAVVKELLLGLGVLSRTIPREFAAVASQQYFRLLANLLGSGQNLPDEIYHILTDNVLDLLTQITSQTLTAYTAFALEFLPEPDLESKLGRAGLDKILGSINYKLLASALATLLSASIPDRLSHDSERKLWLLARFIYAHDHALQGRADIASDPDYVSVVSTLLSSGAEEISARINVEDTVMSTTSASRSTTQPLPSFVSEQIKRLVQQNRVSSLLTQSVASKHDGQYTTHAQQLATYALTLLRVFPGKAEDIRSWLFMGSTSSSGVQGSRVSPIRFFWQATMSTRLFLKIRKDQKQALSLLRPPTMNSVYKDTSNPQEDLDAWNKDWQMILLFFELYTFILRYMDDEEFLTAGIHNSTSANGGQLWTKEGALPLRDVKELTIFLKHLAFTLYWNAADLEEPEAVADEETIRNYFATHEIPKASKRASEKQQPNAFVGVAGVAVKHLKGLTTGLLRMIHEREYVDHPVLSSRSHITNT